MGNVISAMGHQCFFIMPDVARQDPAAGRTVPGDKLVMQTARAMPQGAAMAVGMGLSQDQADGHHRTAQCTAQATAVAHGLAERGCYGQGLGITQTAVQAAV